MGGSVGCGIRSISFVCEPFNALLLEVLMDYFCHVKLIRIKKLSITSQLKSIVPSGATCSADRVKKPWRIFLRPLQSPIVSSGISFAMLNLKSIDFCLIYGPIALNDSEISLRMLKFYYIGLLSFSFKITEYSQILLSVSN